MPRQILRLNAFTLLELVVAMAVSALLFGLGYAALRLVLHQQQRLHRKADRLYKSSSLQRVLTVDFARAREVQAAATSIRCFTSPRTTDYELLDSVVVRRQGEQTDTFTLAHQRVTCYFQGQTRSQGVVDAVHLSGVTGQDTVTYTAQAYYSAEQLMHFTR